MIRVARIFLKMALIWSVLGMGYGCYFSVPSGRTAIETKIDSLLEIMTLEEKAGQLTLYTSGWTVTGPKLRDDYLDELKAGRAGNLFNAHTVAYAKELQRIAVEETRLGIPLLFGLDVIHGYKTTYPIPLAESCTWDLELIEKTARLSAREATASGVNWTYNPMVDITRDPRWGRVAEGSGEDVFLGSLIGAAKVRGYQGADLSLPETMLACVKHFAAYGAAQAGRDYHTVDVSDRVLRDTYLPPYRAAIEAGATTVMTSFNELDGIPASGSQYLMTEILRDEWGFEGFVVTDYTAINEMVQHGIVENEKEAAAFAFDAGVEMDMQGGLFSRYLPELVNEGRIAEERLDACVRRVLRMKFDLGLFDDPYRYLNKERETETLFSEEFMQHALESANESIVLLENDGILPLSKGVNSLALIGPLADNQKDLLGTWHVAGVAEKVITLRQGLKNVAPNVTINYARGADFKGNDRSGFREAISTARQSEVIVYAIGENYQQSGEAASRTDINIPSVQMELLEELQKLNKPIILVVMAGRPLTLTDVHDKVAAILYTWHLGTMAGQAIAQTLFGDNNPSGKLTMTFPRSTGQIPVFYNMKNTGRPFNEKNKYTSKYIDAPNSPLYPFGYGLSYTSFSYDDFRLNTSVMSGDQSIEAKVTVKNIGDVAGEEIVQWYIQDIVGSVTRPVKELKGFEKIALVPGASREVTFTIDQNDLIFYARDKTWKSEPGDFKLFVGTHAQSLMEVNFELK